MSGLFSTVPEGLCVLSLSFILTNLAQQHFLVECILYDNTVCLTLKICVWWWYSLFRDWLCGQT